MDQARVIAALSEAAGDSPIGEISEYEARRLKPHLGDAVAEVREAVVKSLVGKYGKIEVRWLLKTRREQEDALLAGRTPGVNLITPSGPMMAEEQPVRPKRRRGPGRPFRKGQSGNPGGAPRKGSSLVEHLATVLKEVDPESGKPHVQLLAEKYVDLAIAGNVTALENIMARFHGRPEQGVRLSGDDLQPLHIRVPERDGPIRVRHSPRDKPDTTPVTSRNITS